MNPQAYACFNTVGDAPEGFEFVLVRMADDAGLFVPLTKHKSTVHAHLDLVFHDVTEDYGAIKAPTMDDARAIWEFHEKHHDKYFVAQCQNGIGRSRAVVAAIYRAYGMAEDIFLLDGTHNRLLYNMMLDVAGVAPPTEPLVSVVVRLKYPPEYFQAFVLSMRRQKYPNWEIIAVTDGPGVLDYMPAAKGDPRVRFIETEEYRGRWGHPYRQRGIDAARGDWVVLTNDDNYYLPGWLAQSMAVARIREDIDIISCASSHIYSGWRFIKDGGDVGMFITKRKILQSMEWKDCDFHADTRYFNDVIEKAGGRLICIDIPHLVKN